VQNAFEIQISGGQSKEADRTQLFLLALALGIVSAALLASWLPLQVSIATVFLFAGPHNWFELRYFLMRLPVRFGRSRAFFLTAFGGLAFLTSTYVSLPLIYRATAWSNEAWLILLGSWNTLLLAWVCTLALLRGKQKPRSNWTWIVPAIMLVGALNWLQPDLFSLALVYIHPLVALWFLDRQLKRTRQQWLKTYRRSLILIPIVVAVMAWQLSQTTSLSEDNGLFWRITQHSGAELLPNISSHLLVSVHLFLEMLHYGVWIVALPLVGMMIGPGRNNLAHVLNLKTVPVATHPRGFPKLVTTVLAMGVAVVLILWVGFAVDYSTTRDIYFTVAIAHVIAEAPFLMKML